jgi:2-amino-4-hydroxy-6-hydroxymethyldihydropteridine diphosphokinase
MHRVIISLASNRFQKQNLLKARTRLQQILLFPNYSDELWTEPIGSRKEDLYLNQLVKAETQLTFDELNNALKTIEKEFGRTERKRSMKIVPIDLDILQYDDERYHLNDWDRLYVKDLIDSVHRA